MRNVQETVVHVLNKTIKQNDGGQNKTKTDKLQSLEKKKENEPYLGGLKDSPTCRHSLDAVTYVKKKKERIIGILHTTTHRLSTNEN